MIAGAAQLECGLPYAWYPESLVPLLFHPAVTVRGPAVARALSALQLLGYLRFTVELESGPVQRVMGRLCDQTYFPERSEWLKSEALCIAEEEMRHAQVHRDAVSRFEASTGLPASGFAPAFLARLEGLCRGYSSSQRAFVELLFVCVSETLITSELRTIARDERVHPGVRTLARTHADDESRHAAYFHRLFADCWKRFDRDQREMGALLLPKLLHAYLDPDRELMLSNLRSSGVRMENPAAVVDAVCAGSAVRDRMLRAAKPTLRMFNLASVPLEVW